MGIDLSSEDVSCKGISNLTEAIAKDAFAEGCHWKLLGKAMKQSDGPIVTNETPKKLSVEHPLSGISGAENALTFTTDMLGDVTVSGPGAGRIETAYAIVGYYCDLSSQGRLAWPR